MPIRTYYIRLLTTNYDDARNDAHVAIQATSLQATSCCINRTYRTRFERQFYVSTSGNRYITTKYVGCFVAAGGRKQPVTVRPYYNRADVVAENASNTRANTNRTATYGGIAITKGSSLSSLTKLTIVDRCPGVAIVRESRPIGYFRRNSFCKQ